MLRAFACLVVSASVLLAASISLAQSAPTSDLLDEIIIDHHGNPINHPISIPIPEGDPANPEPGGVITVPPRTIDFVHPGVTGQQTISDRFHLDAFQVTVRSDLPETGLAQRTGATLIPLQANERFLPVSFLLHSDGENVAGTNSESDHMHIVGGFYSGQPAALIKVLSDVSIPEAVPPDPNEPGVAFEILPQSYDVQQANAGPNLLISDYLDTSRITGFFISSDNPADYSTALPVDGTVKEDGLPNDPNFGADLHVDLQFTSDTEVPEPGTLVLLTVGLLSLGLTCRSRFVRKGGQGQTP